MMSISICDGACFRRTARVGKNTVSLAPLVGAPYGTEYAVRALVVCVRSICRDVLYSSRSGRPVGCLQVEGGCLVPADPELVVMSDLQAGLMLPVLAKCVDLYMQREIICSPVGRLLSPLRPPVALSRRSYNCRLTIGTTSSSSTTAPPRRSLRRRFSR